MRPRSPAARSRKSPRRWHLLPPLVHGPEALEGASVLDEIRDPLGAVLWQTLRDVMLWAEALPEDRGELFAAGAGERRREAVADAAAGSPLEPALLLISRLLARPGGESSRSVSRACSDIAAWAEAQQAPQSSLAFAQAAAVANPSEPAAAFAVARIAARLADHARAEVWFRRAIGLARRARNWRMYARAFSGLGNLYLTRGNFPAAHRFHLRALRGARRGGLRGEQAAALHDLFGVAIETGRTAEAERYAREAAASYGPRNPRLAALAHDVAYFWMERGHFAHAAAVFQEVLPLIAHPVERLFVQADLMRAAAGAGQTDLARQMAAEVWSEALRPELSAGAPRALLELGRGALQLADWELAERAATGAARAAEQRMEGKTRLAAEALVDAARAGRSAAPSPPVARATDVSPPGKLADDLIQSLRAMAGQAR